MCKRKGTTGFVLGFALVLGGKAAWLSLELKSFWPLLHQVGISAQISTRGWMHILSVFLVEFHSFSIISFMIDLIFFLFLPIPGSYFTVD